MGHERSIGMDWSKVRSTHLRHEKSIITELAAARIRNSVVLYLCLEVPKRILHTR